MPIGLVHHGHVGLCYVERWVQAKISALST